MISSASSDTSRPPDTTITDFTVSRLATDATPAVVTISMGTSLSPTTVSPTYTHSYGEPSPFAAASSIYSTHISLAPTPTQTSLQVFSTAAVDVPRNNTTDDKIDDGSVVFNSSDKGNMCSDSVSVCIIALSCASLH